MDETNVVIGKDQIMAAQEVLDKYRQGKQSIDQKATSNQEWWRLRHWDQIADVNDQKKNEEKPVSAWLFNSIINKHADIMDNFPKPNILPRTEQDVEEAEMLSEIIPIMLEQNDYEDVYDTCAYEFVIDGGAITGVFWDATANNGAGSNIVKNVDVHNVFWEPGVNDIQDSANFFNVSLEDADTMKIAYPEHADEIEPMDSGMIAKYIHDDNVDTTDKVEVVDWYYKKTVMVAGVEDDEGNVLYESPKTVLHYVKYCCDVVLYSSEDDPDYAESGYYQHGLYPFVVRRLYPVKDTPWGFGFVDVMKSPQKYIDVVDQAILKNTMMMATPRFFVKRSTDINTEDFADWSKPFIEVSGGDLEGNVLPVSVVAVPDAAIGYQEKKVNELKETSGNRDFSQGSTVSGVTAASAIASLQEAGSKIPRDINKKFYRGHQEEVRMMVENIKQFAEQPQTFRVDNANGGFSFVTYDNSKIKDSIFDIKIVAEKQSPFSRAAQNETAKEMYGMGMFSPEMTLPALTCIDMMEFEGKDKVKENIQNNSAILQQLEQLKGIILTLDEMIPGLAMQAGLIDPAVVEEQAGAQRAEVQMQRPEGTAEERAARQTYENDTTRTAKARQKAARQASIGG